MIKSMNGVYPTLGLSFPFKGVSVTCLLSKFPGIDLSSTIISLRETQYRALTLLRPGLIALLLFGLSCSFQLLFGQILVDPSQDDPDYDTNKEMGMMQVAENDDASLNLNRPTVSKQANASQQMPGPCFVARDASFIAVPRNDDGSLNLNIPFSFELYGTSYNSLWINTNGNISFGGPLSAFSSTGFPTSTPMVAPFWADVDTRNTLGGQIYYKINPTNIIVTWEGVGYYNQMVDKRNTFQVIISTLADPLTGVGNNVTFGYGDMQWTTGSASGGTGGFGGTPATLGVNAGNNIDFVQVGRFNTAGTIYDGPSGSNNGVDFLDDGCFNFDVSSAGNVPPTALDFPAAPVTIACGETFMETYSFIAPENGQNVSAVVNANGACNTTSSTTSGSIATVTVTLHGDLCNLGTNTIDIAVTDDGVPPETSNFQLTIIVDNSGICPSACTAGVGDLVITEIMRDPTTVSDANGEWFEVYNPTGAPIDMQSIEIKDDGTDDHIIISSLIVPAGGYVVLGRNSDMAANGGISIDYAYGSDITLANGVDELILECSGTEIDRVEFTGFPTTAGASIKLDPSALNAADNDSASNWCVSTTDISGTNTNKGTPGIANPSCCGMDPSAPPPVVSLTSVPSSACEGTNVQISASVSGGQGAIGSANPESIIPRSNDTYADNLITLDGGGSVSATSKITVSLNIDHNRISDVDAYLVGPGDCGAYELFTDVGGGGDNMTNTVLASDAATLISSGSAPFSGTFRPEGDFTLPPSYANAATTGVTTSLLGCPVSGDWTLKLIDDQTGTNGGVLTDWSLAISPTGVAPSFTLSDGTNTIETNETGVFSVTPAIGTTDYTIDYRGPNGCMGQGMTSVDIFDVPAIDDITTTCANANDGTITVGATIDNANFAGTDIGIIEYSFDGGLSWETDNMESDLAPGVYQVGVRNSATTDCATNFTPVTLSGPIVANDLQVCTGAPSPLDAPFIVDEDCDPVFMAMTITTGTLDANDDTYAKSSNENSYLPGATVSYDVISIRPGQSGNYRIESCGFGFDGSLSIYTAPFDPDNPGTNFIRMDDDGYNGGSGCANGNDGAFGTNNPRVTLDVNQEYILVIQGENSGELGNWEIRFTGGPAAVFVGEPAQIEWYDAPMGGNLVGTGMTFDPTVATAENTNPVSTGTAGTTTFYAACSGAQGDCRVPAVFTVTQLPTVTITADPTGDICLGSTVQYNAEVTPNNSDYTYFWSAYNGPFNNNNGPNNGFNDRTLQNPTRAWTASAGDKSVGVVVSTPSCPDVEVGYDFNVNPLPTVDILPFQQNPFATLCSGETGVYLANISNAGGGIVNSYTWSVDPSAGVNITPQGQSGDVSGTRNIQIDFPLNTGTTDITYTVTLVLEDANGCVNTASQVVVVQPQPADPIPGTTAKEVCQDPDLTPNLTNTGINVTNTLAANEKVVWVLTGIPTGSSYSMGQEFTTDDCGDSFQNFGELAVANFSKVIRVNDPENAPEGTYTFETYIVNCDTDCESARVDGFSITVNPLPTLSCPTVAPQCPNGASIDLSLLDYSESPVGGIFAFSGAGVSGTNFDPETAGVGTHTITVTYTAPNGCDEECTIDVEVFADIDPPTFTCPADREVVLDANCQFEVPDLITGILVDDNCPAATIAQDPIATTLISSADEQTSVVTIIATDAAGNTNTTACEVTLTAQDMTPPEAICQDVTVSLDANGMAVVMASAVNNGSTDNCGIQSISLIDASLNADQNVTPEVIFGTGNINGAFTINES
ncbi:MAG: nidogen-like domain-containing protein, partial [Bacteroidota bacterium]